MATAPATAPRGRFHGRRLYVAPGSKAELQAKTWATTRPTDAEMMRRLSLRPVTRWFGEFDGRSDEIVIREHLDRAGDDLAPIVLYYDWKRDLGSFSAGGAPTPEAFDAWVDKVCRAIVGKPRMIVGSPDSVSMWDRMNGADRAIRIRLLRRMVGEIYKAGSEVYMCAGSGNWIPPKEQASRLREIGARNFALNISGTQRTSDEISYANAIRAELGFDARWVLDVSRNGRGPYEPKPGEDPDISWLNSPERGVGADPSVSVSQATMPGCDGRLDVKSIGASDGEDDRGHLPAGKWSAEVALDLAKRAVPALAKTRP